MKRDTKRMKQLSENVRQKINSMQAITNFASIIKELGENSIDAGTTRLEISMSNFGLDGIKVTDNGPGICPDDAEVICLRHYTSKLNNFSELAALKSYGFRGEAMSSLCGLASVKLTTRTADDNVGRVYTFTKLGEIASSGFCAAQPGTLVVVRDIFVDLPVRRQQLVSLTQRTNTLAAVERIVIGLSLANPSLHVCLLHNSDRIFVRPSCSSRIDAVKTSLCRVKHTLLSHLGPLSVEIPHCNNGHSISIELFLPANKKEAACLMKSQADFCFVIVNGRPVTSKSIRKVVSECCSLYFELSSRYPIAVIYIDLPVDRTDVNIEPDKSVVKLEDEKLILDRIREELTGFYSISADNMENVRPADNSESHESLSEEVIAPIVVNKGKDSLNKKKEENNNNNEDKEDTNNKTKDKVNTVLHQQTLPLTISHRTPPQSNEDIDPSSREISTSSKPSSMMQTSLKGWQTTTKDTSMNNNENHKSINVEILPDSRSPDQNEVPVDSSNIGAESGPLINWSMGRRVDIPAEPTIVHVGSRTPSDTPSTSRKRCASPIFTPPDKKRLSTSKDPSKLTEVAGRNSSEVILNWDRIKQRYSLKEKPGSQSGPQPLKLVGHIPELALITFLQEGTDNQTTSNRKIFVANRSRVLECATLQVLIQETQIKSRKLEPPFLLTKESFSDESIWTALVGKPFQLIPNGDETSLVVSDPRISKNGFRITVDADPKNMSVVESMKVVGVPKELSVDFREVLFDLLEGIAKHKDWNFRPRLVLEHLKCEACRLREDESAGSMREMNWQQITARLSEYLVRNGNLCSHNVPVGQSLSIPDNCCTDDKN